MVNILVFVLCRSAFSSPEAADRLVSTRNHDLWKGSIFGASAENLFRILNQSDCQTCRESWTSGVGPSLRSRFLELTKRSAASGDKNNRLSGIRFTCCKANASINASINASTYADTRKRKNFDLCARAYECVASENQARQPYCCPKTIARPPCLYPNPILWKLLKHFLLLWLLATCEKTLYEISDLYRQKI